MKTFTTLLLFLCCCYGLLAQNEGPNPIPGQYIVLLSETAATPIALNKTVAETREQSVFADQPKRAVIKTKLSELLQKANIAGEKVLAVFVDALVGFSATLTAEEAAQLSADPDVAGVYQDYYILLEPQPAADLPTEYSESGQIIPCAVLKAGGYKNATSKNWIWILDTGIDLDHPDLAVGDLSPFARSFIPGETYNDANGHGTHVAGIAAAKNNSFGIVGVSAGALVIPVKVLSNSGLASITYVVQGLNHVSAYSMPNDVANLGLGAFPVRNCSNNNPALKKSIINLGKSGVWVCMAAGDNADKASYCTPGCINGSKVITVGATTCAGACYSESNWGPTVVDWVATGVNVYSTYKNGTYTTLSGSAQATAIVSGIIHANGGPPVSGGTVTCGNVAVVPAPYKKAKQQ